MKKVITTNNKAKVKAIQKEKFEWAKIKVELSGREICYKKEVHISKIILGMAGFLNKVGHLDTPRILYWVSI